MDKVLFIIDMQEIYVGRGRNTEKYNYNCESLIDEVNKRIAAYKPEEVFYFKSIAKGLGGLIGSFPKAGTHEAKLVERMKIVGKNVYERSKSDVLSLDEIVDLLRARNVKEIELVGADINNSIGLTAVAATNDLNISIIYNHGGIVSNAPDKTLKMMDKFKKNKVIFTN